MVCADCLFAMCVGVGCKKAEDAVADAQKKFLELAKDVPQLKGVLPKGSLLNTPMVKSGSINNLKENRSDKQ